jgi:hypothetical protein
MLRLVRLVDTLRGLRAGHIIQLLQLLIRITTT